MIRSAIKSGLKKLLGREGGASEVRPPPPAWKKPSAAAATGANREAEEAQRAEDAKALAAKADLERKAAERAAADAAKAEAAKQEAAKAEAAKQEAAKAEAAKAEAAKAGPAESVAAAPEEAPPEPKAEAARPMAPTDDTAGPALTIEAVQAIMDDMVRPALQGDGGDITLLKVEDNDVYVKLVGSCSTCPSSIMTMKMGVEALLKEEFPSMRSLIQVD